MVFDIYVGDMFGQVVPSQEVGVRYFNSTGMNQLSLMTDASGRIGVTVLEHDQDLLDLMVWVDDGSFNHTVDTYIPHFREEDVEEDPEAPEPYGYEFEVQAMEYRIDPMSDSERAFWAFSEGEPLNRSTVYYYVYTDREILSTGRATTDTEGRFVASFSPPFEEFEKMNFDFLGEMGYHPGIFEGYDWEDSDNDGYSDGFEKEIGTDPEDYWDRPVMAQHSDWAFIMKTGTMVEYANRRTWNHLSRFNRLFQDLEADRLDPDWLTDLESRDNIFPELDFKYTQHRVREARRNMECLQLYAMLLKMKDVPSIQMMMLIQVTIYTSVVQ